MTYELPKLTYDYGDLEPHIDAQTMEIHHSKHHAGYVSKLNNALEKHPDFKDKSLQDLLSDLDSLPEKVKKAVRDNGGGHFNHSLFWSVMGPVNGNDRPKNKLIESIDNTFGSFDEFKEKFSKEALGVFGSGWVWLVKESSALEIVTTANQNNPIMEGKIAILGLDVWEHAYYLKHQNRRVDYVENWWNVINWDEVERRFAL